MSKIFIGYARKDDPERNMCKQIEDHLTPEFEVWFDRDLGAGDDWWNVIKSKLDWCQGFICLISRNWLDSTHCQQEFDIASYGRKKIIPIWIDKLELSELPEQLTNLQRVDGFDRNEQGEFSIEAIRKLIHASYTMIPSGVTLHATGLVDPVGFKFEWCEIPSGNVTVTNNNIGDRQIYTVHQFCMSKFLVTNLQFRYFIKTGYAQRYWWHYSDDAYNHRLNATQPPITEGDDNLPCVNVNWYDAMAFCNWLTDRLGIQITLPTELQWQRAAQGDDKRIYPWGNDFSSAKCNTLESGFGRPTFVSRYTEGVSAYGVFDLSGNVQEWCLNEYDSPVGNRTEVTNPQQAVRGGSWRLNAESAKTTFRSSQRADYTSTDIGFRLIYPG